MKLRLITQLPKPENEDDYDLRNKCRYYLNKIQKIDGLYTLELSIGRVTISKETGSVSMYLRSMDSKGEWIPFCRYTVPRKALESV